MISCSARPSWKSLWEKSLCLPTISHCPSWVMKRKFELPPVFSPLCSNSESTTSPLQPIWDLWLRMRYYLSFFYVNKHLPVLNHLVATVIHNKKSPKVKEYQQKSIQLHSIQNQRVVSKKIMFLPEKLKIEV